MVCKALINFAGAYGGETQTHAQKRERPKKKKGVQSENTHACIMVMTLKHSDLPLRRSAHFTTYFNSFSVQSLSRRVFRAGPIRITFSCTVLPPWIHIKLAYFSAYSFCTPSTANVTTVLMTACVFHGPALALWTWPECTCTHTATPTETETLTKQREGNTRTPKRERDKWAQARNSHKAQN